MSPCCPSTLALCIHVTLRTFNRGESTILTLVPLKRNLFGEKQNPLLQLESAREAFADRFPRQLCKWRPPRYFNLLNLNKKVACCLSDARIVALSLVAFVFGLICFTGTVGDCNFYVFNRLEQRKKKEVFSSDLSEFEVSSFRWFLGVYK